MDPTTLADVRGIHFIAQAVDDGGLPTQGAVKRPGRGRPRIRPKRVVGDKAYSGRHIRRYLRRRGIGVVIPHRKDEHCRGPFDQAAYRQRNVAERLVNRFK